MGMLGRKGSPGSLLEEIWSCLPQGQVEIEVSCTWGCTEGWYSALLWNHPELFILSEIAHIIHKAEHRTCNCTDILLFAVRLWAEHLWTPKGFIRTAFFEEQQILSSSQKLYGNAFSPLFIAIYHLQMQTFIKYLQSLNQCNILMQTFHISLQGKWKCIYNAYTYMYCKYIYIFKSCLCSLLHELCSGNIFQSKPH